jgi:hypothetical protein
MSNKASIKEIVIDGETYVPKGSQPEMASSDGMKFVIIRSLYSGVHAGYLLSRDGSEVKLADSIRIWYWSGAATLSQLAMDGPANPIRCKFAMSLPEITVLGVCEVIPCTEKAKIAIEGVTAWKV